MSWVDATTKILVYRQDSYEFRTDPDDDSKLQKRKRRSLVYEYRGLTQAGAEAYVLAIPANYSNVNINASMNPIAAGGWIVVEEKDYIIGSWTTAEGDEP